MNNQMKSLLAVLLIIAVLLITIPPIWFKVIGLTVFSGVLIFCVIKFRNSTTYTSLLLSLAGIILSAIASAKMLANIANEVIEVKYAIVVAVSLASLAFLLWVVVICGRTLYKALKKPKQPIN